MKTIKAYSRVYQPFRMGGQPHRWQYAILTSKMKRFVISKGISVMEVQGPNNKIAIIEIASGGYVGDSIAQVKRDFKDAPKAVTVQAIKDCKEQISKSMSVDPVSEEKWWENMRG